MNFEECGGGNGLWNETVLLQVALKERGVFCFGNGSVGLDDDYDSLPITEMKTSRKRT